MPVRHAGTLVGEHRSHVVLDGRRGANAWQGGPPTITSNASPTGPSRRAVGQFFRWRGSVTCLVCSMLFSTVVEVEAVRPRRIRIILDRRYNVGACSQKTERQASTTREHVQHARASSSAQALDLSCDRWLDGRRGGRCTFTHAKFEPLPVTRRRRPPADAGAARRRVESKTHVL